MAEEDFFNIERKRDIVIIILTASQPQMVQKDILLVQVKQCLGHVFKDFHPSSIKKFISQRSISSTPAYRTMVF